MFLHEAKYYNFTHFQFYQFICTLKMKTPDELKGTPTMSSPHWESGSGTLKSSGEEGFCCHFVLIFTMETCAALLLAQNSADLGTLQVFHCMYVPYHIGHKKR